MSILQMITMLIRGTVLFLPLLLLDPANAACDYGFYCPDGTVSSAIECPEVRGFHLFASAFPSRVCVFSCL